jgi:hypothetical protein
MSDRFYTATFNGGKAAPHFPYIYDPNAIISGGGVGNPLSTGAWRPWQTTDNGATNLTVSGGINVGNVAVTGGVIGIIGTPPITVANSVLAISGNTVNNGGFVSVSNATGGYSPVFTGLSSGQIQIPQGVKAYSITVASGSAYLQSTYLPFGTSVGGGQYGGGFLSNFALNVGCTGGYTLVTWET